MNTRNGRTGDLAEVAYRYLNRDLPDDAVWEGNQPADGLDALLLNTGVKIGAPKGRDNLTEAELERYLEQMGAAGSDSLISMADLDLPSSSDLANQGVIGVYRLTKASVEL